MMENQENQELKMPKFSSLQEIFIYFGVVLLVVIIGFATMMTPLLKPLGFANIEDLQEKMGAVANGENLDLIPSFRIVNILYQIIAFLLPPLVFASIFRKDGFSWLRLNKLPSFKYLMWCLLLMVVSYPAIIGLYDVSQRIMGVSDSYNTTVEALMKMNGVGELIQNIVLMGIVAALSEELMFRGGLQKLFEESSGNVHSAIFFAAGIFSMMHGDLPGFIPRMLLGILFGYMVVKSGSLWTSVIVHAFHNTWQLAAYYWGQSIATELHQQNEVQFPLYATAISLVLTIYLLIKFFRMDNGQLTMEN